MELTIFNDKLCKNLTMPSIFNKSLGEAVVSILLSNKELKAVVLEQEQELGVGFTYSKSYLEEAEQPWYAQEELLDEELGRLKEALKEQGYKPNEVSLIIAFAGIAYLELLDMPCLAKQDLEQALAWELPQRLPWEEGSYEYRYLCKPKQKQEQETLAKMQELNIYCVPKNYLEKLHKALHKHGLIPNGIYVTEELADCSGYDEVLKTIDFYEAYYNTEKLRELREQYYEPLAVALGYIEKKLSLDFLSKQGQRQSKLKKWASPCRWLALLCFGVSILGLGFAYYWESYEAQRFTDVQGQYAELRPWQEKRAKLESVDKEIQRLKNSLETIEKERVVWSRVLDEIGRRIPQGCWLTKLEQQPTNKKLAAKALLLTGKTESPELLLRFVEQLKTVKAFDLVQIVNSGIQTNSDAYNGELQGFCIEVKIKGGKHHG